MGTGNNAKKSTETGKQSCQRVTLPKNKVTFKPCCPLCPSSMYDRHDVNSYDDAITFLETQMKQKRDVLIKHNLHGNFMEEALESPLSFIEIMTQMENKEKVSRASAGTAPITHKCGCSLCPHNVFDEGTTPFGEPDTFEDKQSKSFDVHATKGRRNKQNKRTYIH